MIVTRTPLRISFLGGGTDYPDFFQDHGGQTIGITIDKHSYVAVHTRADNLIQATYSKIETTDNLGDIQHPSVRECLRFFKIRSGIEINYMGDLPRYAGLGSSSSFTVALLHALHSYTGRPVDQETLATEAVDIEQNWIKERVGVQDQYLCAIGGLLHLAIDRDGTVNPKAIPVSPEYLSDLHRHLMLFDTGIRREASTILAEQIDRTRNGDITEELCRIGAIVEQGLQVLLDQESPEFLGELLHAQWRIKKRLSSQMTTTLIDTAYSRGRAAGAVGGKLLGAGGGGMLLFVAPPKHHATVQKAVGLPLVPFSFDHAGSQVLFP